MKAWMILGSVVTALLIAGGYHARGYWAFGPEILIVIAAVTYGVATLLLKEEGE